MPVGLSPAGIFLSDTSAIHAAYPLRRLFMNAAHNLDTVAGDYPPLLSR